MPFRIAFYDVGQGVLRSLGILKDSPFLIDTGPSPHTAALMASEGISKLDLVILSLRSPSSRTVHKIDLVEIA